MDNVPEDVRKRYFYIIPMPLTIEGHGPASHPDIHRLTFEIWDLDLSSHSSFEHLPDAIQECEKLNKEFYARWGSDESYTECNYA